ncbi:hypothetical protein FGU71_13590 [Erythrobacter insulae]|uniref:Uncharacterized protein n=1 Tax=Erythrobacter insulae TaxID=2584124 RepID=A0A547P7A0_9SPHN|nr:hypothetical protein [Erythrobacter insulae]TRD10023.1 hypothetical protein FGU71_13590 [Erythrobacter insulae]
MTRKLFAFLALLSGLAALGGTATASYAHTSSACNASVMASAENAASDRHIQSDASPGIASVGKKDAAENTRLPRPQSLRMPVLMGIDRAYE